MVSSLGLLERWQEGQMKRVRARLALVGAGDRGAECPGTHPTAERHRRELGYIVEYVCETTLHYNLQSTAIEIRIHRGVCAYTALY